MSEDLNKLEEGTEIREQHSGGQRDDGTDLNMSGHTERDPDLNRRFYKKMNVAKKLFVVKKIIIKLKPFTFVFPSIWCAYKISIEPFFNYDTLINFEKKCLVFNDNEEMYLRLSFLNIILIIGSLLSVIISTRRLEMIIWIFLLILDLWLYLPILLLKADFSLADDISWYSQLTLYPNPERLWSSFYAANLFLLYFFGTVILIYMTFIRATRTSSRLAKATWAKAAVNLVLYIHGGHIFGSLWYWLATDKLLDCWKKALCKHLSDCNSDNLYCVSLGNSPSSQRNQLLDDFCSIETRNTTLYDFGIYFDALSSRIVGVSSLPRRILHGFRWGLQNLSGFGQNLNQTSTDAWENIFVVSITIYGVVLFVFFIGNMQIYLQTKTVRSETVKQKKQEIEESKSFAKLSQKLQKQIKRYQPDKWHETICVDFDNLFNNLPEDLKRNTKREFCLKILNKVDEFRSWNDNESLDKLCDFVKPISYNEHTQVIGRGNLINEMLFLVQGKLKSYSFKSVDNDTARCEITIDLLEDGDFCGEELVDLFRVNPFASNLPISTRTIQTLTNVDAFALTFYDLQTLFIERHKALTSTEEQAAPAEPQPPAPTMQSQQQP